MRRDVGMTDELSVPDLSRSQSEGFSPHHSLRTDSQNGMFLGFHLFYFFVMSQVLHSSIGRIFLLPGIDVNAFVYVNILFYNNLWKLSSKHQ